MSNNTAIISPVRQSVRVPAEPARAFRAFTSAMREWGDPAVSANPTKSQIAEIVIEPAVGGQWFERGADGSECEWARVVAWESGARLEADWHPDGKSTTLEIRFENPAPARRT